MGSMGMPAGARTSIPDHSVIIFDLFHTLSTIRHAKIPGPETHELLQVDREIYVDALFNRAEDRLVGRISDPVEIIRDIAVHSGSEVAAAEYVAIATRRAKRFADSLLAVSPKVLDALDCLRAHGKRLALISNADRMESAGWRVSPLAERFEQVLFSCDVALAKPDPAIYELCLARMNADASDALFVGDGGSNEFRGAAAAGIATVCTTEFIKDIFPDKIAERVAAADYSVGALAELCAAMEGGTDRVE